MPSVGKIKSILIILAFFGHFFTYLLKIVNLDLIFSMWIFSGDVWVATKNGSAFVTWDEPVFADNVAVERVINKGGLSPGQALQWGTYDVAYVAYDGAGNTAQCDFKIYVLNK